MAGEFVRDKDAVISCCLIAEASAWARSNGKSLLDILQDIYLEFGFYKELLISVVRKGKKGAEEIQGIMDNYRNNPPSSINNSKLILIKDYLTGKIIDLNTKTEKELDLPKSNVLQFYLEDGSKISVRPSGTEPKIKYYFSVKENLDSKNDYDRVNEVLDNRFKSIISSLDLK